MIGLVGMGPGLEYGQEYKTAWPFSLFFFYLIFFLFFLFLFLFLFWALAEERSSKVGVKKGTNKEERGDGLSYQKKLHYFETKVYRKNSGCPILFVSSSLQYSPSFLSPSPMEESCKNLKI